MIWKKLSQWFTREKPEVVNSVTQQLTREQATAQGLPYVNIEKLHLDPKNPSAGSIELDYNELFVLKLRSEGYEGNTDDQVVDRWFTQLCKSIAMEMYEQWDADPKNRLVTSRKDIGGGRYEIG